MAKNRRREIRQQVFQALTEHLELPVGAPFAPEDAHHPADIADVLWFDLEKEQAKQLFECFPEETRAEVLAEAEPRLTEVLIDGIEPEDLAKLLEHISADDGTDILELVPEELRQKVLCFVEPEDASDLRHLGEYAPDTAGGMMTTEFITARQDERVGDLLKRIKRDEDDAETIHAIYVIDEREILQGVISSRELLEAGIHDLIGDIMIPDVILAKVDEDQEDVAHRLLHYNLSTVPVVDPRGVVVGIVTADDALEVLEGEGSEDALLLAGAGPESDASESPWDKVVKRGPMLAIPVVAGLVMSRVMDSYAPGLAHAGSPTPETEGSGVGSFMPMVLALSGTVGMQTSAVLVRGFAVGQIVEGKRLRVFWSEVCAGTILGTICALVALVMASITSPFPVALAIGLSLMLAMTWTTTVASGIAMGTEALGRDPAVVAGPLMIAVSDLSAVVIFFVTASALLEKI
ncbi:MAG: magnesium transporter [Planctomycetes bacterium]|nr:magnesium transporter [Planctomycetota bacterium]